MKKYTLQNLKVDAEKRKQRHSKTLKARYALARALGFTSEEAVILQSRTEKIIRELAKDRDGI